MTRDEVIRVLENCAYSDCDNCLYYSSKGCMDRLIADIVTLLKEEPVRCAECVGHGKCKIEGILSGDDRYCSDGKRMDGGDNNDD